MRDVIRLHSGVDLRYEEVTEFDYWQCKDSAGRCLPKGEWSAVHLEFTVNHLHRIEPVENIQSHLVQLRSYFDVHLATSRLPQGHDLTRAWLERHGIPFDIDKLHFVGHREKHKIPHSFAIAVEDDREQALLFLEQGVQPFLLAHPWNVVASELGIRRVSNWLELLDVVMS